jgi:SAM-dependent methyltransferase
MEDENRKMTNIYTSGDYLETTQTWHTEDSHWKANQIAKIIADNGIKPQTIAEIGCGGGMILKELADKDFLSNAGFVGYDISPQAIELSNRVANEKVTFFCEDLLIKTEVDPIDILMAIDVFEHVPDYMGFLNQCRTKAEYKIYHIPLDLHVSSVLRNAFITTRSSIGHIHYFTADSAIATLKDTGHEIVDYFYTDGAFGVYKQHPSVKKAMANIPRWIFSRFSVPFAARLLGGYSLLVLAK